jgi:hypothetical protein
MEIGDLVSHHGRACYLRGLDPMSMPERRAHLEDAFSGQRFTAPLDEVRELAPNMIAHEEDATGFGEHAQG